MSTTHIPLERPSTARRQLVCWKLWRRWTLFTAVGELLGFTAPALVMAAGMVGRWPDTAQTVAAVLVGAVEGAVFGVAQWLALRHALPSVSRRAWVLATALGAIDGEKTVSPTHTSFDWTWAFVLEPIAPLRTRLIVRVRGVYKPAALRIVVPMLLEPLHFVMERGMLRGIKRRAERQAQEAPNLG